jgi:ubiquinone biosynthesis protein COQ9
MSELHRSPLQRFNRSFRLTMASPHLISRTYFQYASCLSRPARQLTRSRVQHRAYQSAQHPLPPPYTPTESAILSAALRHVPAHGFSETSLRLGAREAGYLDVTTNLFPRGAFDLVNYHLVTRRLGLKDEVQFPDSDKAGEKKKLGVGAKVRLLMLARLRANAEVIGQWQGVRIQTEISSQSIPCSSLARLSLAGSGLCTDICILDEPVWKLTIMWH